MQSDADPAALVHQLARALAAQVIETHISWVLLLPGLAYKLKKPVRLPFLDYSTLERRRHFCEEEVRLNGRLAPSLYLGVSRVTGTPQAPLLDGAGPVLDYAVRMRRFPEGSLFSEHAAAGTLGPSDVDRLARVLGEFHCAAPVAPAGPQAPAAVALSARALAVLQGCAGFLADDQREHLADWIAREGSIVDALWQARRAAGHAREGHGDLHLGNIVEVDGELAAFDCIEFDPGLRCIDVVEDAAFAQMDLAARGLPGLAARFINGWLEYTGEYEGVPGLRLALVYRALVRAMAEHLRGAPAAALGYACQARAWTAAAAPRLAITHGLPGSGKTWRSQRWLQERAGLRIRSDVERKRLFGLGALADSQASGLAIYTQEATQRTYQRLFALARIALRAGWPVVLDAAFLRQDERDTARALAASLGVPFAILDCQAAPEVLHARLAARSGDASEANPEVLERLRAAAQPLRPEEEALREPE